MKRGRAVRVIPAGPVAGVDEAGRGPLAGPVVAGAVVLDPRRPIAGLRDSKVLAPAERESLARAIRERALAWALGWSDASEVDVLDILQATHLAMRRALLGLAIRPARVRVDGNRCPSVAGLGFGCAIEAVVRGDSHVAAISAASILAKTARDAWMTRLAQAYPHYAFGGHKGYPTPEHLRLLSLHGPCRLHRLSFAPVRSRHAPG
jgi:ribonuclease HII